MPNKLILECKHTDTTKTENPQPCKTFLSDDKGNKSSMRLMSFIALIAALTISGLLLFLDRITPESVTLVSLFIFGAFAPKALQKFAEVKE
ncbi:MAG: hypothetical protein QY331_07615 [Melioribacteraceae bacterium]|nr:MAG: hypothetical protein QY331_07615 [Melioribacteraceae bacterium]